MSALHATHPEPFLSACPDCHIEADPLTVQANDDYGRLTRQTSRRLLCAAIAAAGVLAVLYAGFRS